jgi:hypothetical protein
MQTEFLPDGRVKWGFSLAYRNIFPGMPGRSKKMSP